MYEIIKKLCSVGGVSGDESDICDTVYNLLFPYANVVKNDFGCVFAEFGNRESNYTVLLDAHLDRIGFVVTEITPKGFLKLEKCGGIDFRTVPGSVVTVNAKKSLQGVICCMPPHLSDGKEDKAVSAERIYADFGLPVSEVKNLVSVGDTAYFAGQPEKLLGNKVTSPALDNRAGVAAVVKTAQLLNGKKCPCRVVAMFTSQEETYQLGAKTSAFSLEANEAVAIDVSFASQPDISGQYGKINLTEGPMICYSPVLNKNITEKLKSTAVDNKIPFQLEVCSGRTGTNADSVAVCKSGVKTGLVSVPQRYMHTQAEVVDIADIENTALLLEKYILSGGMSNE